MNTKYKLVAIDVDGTLINTNHEIPEYNKMIIKQLAERGIKFVITTGRNDAHVYSLIKELGVETIVVGCNGASVRDIATKETLSLNTIDKDVLEGLLNTLKEKNIQFRAFTLNKVFAIEDIDDDFLENSKKYSEKQSSDEQFEYIIADIRTVVQNDIIKVIILSHDEKYINEVQDMTKNIDGLESVKSAGGANNTGLCLDLVKANVSKASGLKIVADHYGVSMDEIVALGDSENDIDMLSEVGFSVAMENALDIVKNITHMITDTNNNAGVGKALKKIFDI